MRPGGEPPDMTVLVPIDGSDCSFRALSFATEFADRFETDLHVVHVTDVQTEATEELLDRAGETLSEAGFDDDPEVVTDLRKFRAADEVGEVICELVERDGYDHVVMGHHGTGLVGKAILGSATETVIDASEVPATIVP